MLYTPDMCEIDAIIDNASLLDYMHVLSSKVQYTMLHIFAVVDNYPGLFCCYRVCHNRLQYSECTKLIEFLPFRQRISSKWLRSETQSNVSFDSPTFNSRWWRTSCCIHTIFLSCVYWLLIRLRSSATGTDMFVFQLITKYALVCVIGACLLNFIFSFHHNLLAKYNAIIF